MHKSTIPQLSIFLGILSLFVYVFVRAYAVGFTHDESISFTIVNGDKSWVLTANNHWLNTKLSYLFAQIFGFSELALRLPNVLAYLVYAGFCYAIVTEESADWFGAIIALAFLLFNPYLIEFFSLFRGYGLAIAFLSGSLYYFRKTYDSPGDLIALSKGVFFSVAAVYANYSFVVPVIAFQLTYFLAGINKIGANVFSKGRIVLFISQILVLVPALHTVIKLSNEKQLYIGGQNNIIEDTLSSVIKVSIQGRYIDHQELVIIVLFLIVIIFSIFFQKRRSFTYLLIVIFISLLMPILLHLLFDFKYPKGRTALYWILFAGVLMAVILKGFHADRSVASFLTKGFFAILSLSVVLSFIKTANISHSRLWPGDADIPEMLDMLRTEVPKGKKCNLLIYWYYEPTINYYRISRNYEWLRPVSRKSLDHIKYDYYYVSKNQNFKMKKKKVIKTFEKTNSKLLKVMRKDGCCPEFKRT